MSPKVVEMLSQLPMVGIFVWFILVWTMRLDKAALEREKERSASAGKIETARQKSEEKRDEAWRSFLADERKHRASSNKRFAKEVKSMSKVLTAIQTVMLAHDERTNLYIDGRIQEEHNRS